MIKKKQAECPPIQMEPVDLSVNRSGVGRGVILTDARHPSPTNGIDLRVNKSSKSFQTAPTFTIYYIIIWVTKKLGRSSYA